MEYLHVDTAVAQESKRPLAPCGDAFFCRRTIYHTTLIVCDGIGSGVRAHVASQMNVSRLAQLLEGGVSLRDAFMSVVETVSGWRDVTMPFSAFSVARIIGDGLSTVLCYEMPPPIFIGLQSACVLSGDPLLVRAGVANEYHFRVAPGEGVVLVSDGIVQAGLGGPSAGGWTVQGVERLLSGLLKEDRRPQALANGIRSEARSWDGVPSGDDKTVAVALSRPGLVVDVMTGPPSVKESDGQTVRDFMARDGIKVVCGATTAEIVARHINKDVEVEQRTYSLSTPPRYFIRGIELVTEGVVTLNQALRILGEDVRAKYDRSAAADLAALFQEADFIRFLVGGASNPVNEDLVYVKQGILARDRVVLLLSEELKKKGKLVSVENV